MFAPLSYLSIKGFHSKIKIIFTIFAMKGRHLP